MNNMNPYASATPQLGPITPGASGGLPPPSTGPTIYENPMAQSLQGMGRGPDSMLVHMSPGEVNSLRGLAQQFGGDLSTNPNTGLPEAGFLSSILPILSGGLLSLIPGVGPLLAAGIVGGGNTIISGDLGKGLLAGLGAFGGASLAGALGAGGASAAGSAAATAGTDAATQAAEQAAQQAIQQSAGAAGTGAATSASTGAAFDAAFAPRIAAQSGLGLDQAALGAAGNALQPTNLLPAAYGGAAGEAAKTGIGGFLDKFATASQQGLGSGMASKAAPYAAGLGLLAPFTQQPNSKPPEQDNEWNYNGPYTQAPRQVSYPSVSPTISRDSSEHQYFTPVNPTPGIVPANQANATADNLDQKDVENLLKKIRGYATGGSVQEHLAALDARNAARALKVAQSAANTGRDPIQAMSNIMRPDATFAPTSANMAKPSATPGLTASTMSPTLNAYLQSIGAITPQGSQAATLTGTPPPTGNINPIPGGLNPTQESSMAQLQGGNPYIYGPRAAPIFNTPYVPPYIPPPPPQQSMSPMEGMRQASPLTSTPSAPGGKGAASSPGLGSSPMSTYASPSNQPSFSPSTSSAPGGKGSGSMPGYSPKPTNPYVYGGGGEVRLAEGSFVMDARTVSELGNGSSSAGQEILAQLGGVPITGSGDGVSDSIHATINGSQPARVARDEVYFSPEAVQGVGGAKKLYAIMDAAHKARQKADRGQDTNLRSQLV